MPAYNKRFGKMAGGSVLKEKCSYLWLLNVEENLVGKVHHLAKPPGRCASFGRQYSGTMKQKVER